MNNTELDRQVAEALGIYYAENEGEVYVEIGDSDDVVAFSPSTDWLICGKLIEEYRVAVSPDFKAGGFDGDCWEAVLIENPIDSYGICPTGYGETPLIAACKALVESKK